MGENITPIIHLGTATLLVLALAFLGYNQSSPDRIVSLSGDDTLAMDEVLLAETGAIFLIQEEAKQLIGISLDGESGVNSTSRQATIIPLPEYPLVVVPTPGGVSVFVLFQNSSIIRVYSAQTFELQREFDTQLGPLVDLSFSPTGERVYVISNQGRVLTEYSHSQLTLSNPVTHSNMFALRAPIANRRGTRLFLEGSESIQVLFGQGLALIERFSPGLSAGVFDPGYSHLWGFDTEGNLRVIDERTGQGVLGSLAQVSLGKTPAVVTNAMNYLSADERRLYQFIPRSTASPRVVQLPWDAGALVRGPGTSVLVFAKDGRAVQIENGRISRSFSLDFISGNSDGSLGTVDFEGSLVAGVAAIVRNDGSFACF